MITPIEDRYLTKEMKIIFSEEAKLESWLQTEAALAKVHAEFGTFSKDIADEIDKKANLDFVKLSRVKEIDHEIHHDVMAMVKALSEVCSPEAARYIHLGATTYDIVDTAWACMFSKGLNIIENRLIRLSEVLIKLTEEHMNTICIGRTHGQHALPYSYGMRFAIWLEEIIRHITRLRRCKETTLVGKMNGAIGTMASFGMHGTEFQRRFLEVLNLNVPVLTNQVVQRDIHAELMFTLTNIASTLAKISKQIRILQRTEIGEIFEPITKKQVGSSTMPMKRNPHKSERISGLYRIIRSALPSILDNNALIEDERDLANSSVERILFPQIFILTDYMMVQLLGILDGLEFNLENIQRNLNQENALMTERIMIALVDKGLGRQNAHELLREAARESVRTKIEFSKTVSENKTIQNFLSKEELVKLFDRTGYLGLTVELTKNSLAKVKSFLNT